MMMPCMKAEFSGHFYIYKISEHVFIMPLENICVKVAQLCLTLCDPYTVLGIFQARILEWVAFPLSRRSSQPRDKTPVSHMQADSLPAEPQRKPKKSGVGSIPLLQGIFPTQELNQGLLHCRQILYQLSYQGSPYDVWTIIIL